MILKYAYFRIKKKQARLYRKEIPVLLVQFFTRQSGICFFICVFRGFRMSQESKIKLIWFTVAINYGIIYVGRDYQPPKIGPT